jgi:leucine-rich repeat protein SHOC2
VRHLQQLRTLDLSDNQFTGVPAEVGQLRKLEVLDLSNNQLTGLPHELGNLQNLQVLDLRGNNISEYDLDVIRSGLPESVNIVR